jgi:hypothetical protein
LIIDIVFNYSGNTSNYDLHSVPLDENKNDDDDDDNNNDNNNNISYWRRRM